MLDKQQMIEAGFKYDDALKRFAGNEKLYEKYIVKFLDDTHYQQAKEAYEEKNYQQVLEMTHALKGVAGTLGMEELFQASSAVVEDVRKDTLEQIDQHFEQVTDLYERMVGFVGGMQPK